MFNDDVLSCILDEIEAPALQRERSDNGYAPQHLYSIRRYRMVLLHSFALTCRAWGNVGQPRLFRLIHLCTPDHIREFYELIVRKPLLISRTVHLGLGHLDCNANSGGRNGYLLQNVPSATDAMNSSQFLQLCERLTSLESPHIIHATAKHDWYTRSSQGLQRLSSEIRNLHLQDLTISREGLLLLLGKFPHLDTLISTDCTVLSTLNVETYDLPMASCAKLRTLSISHWGRSFEVLECVELAMISPKLVSLSLIHPVQVNLGCLTITQSASTLTNLAIIFEIPARTAGTRVSQNSPPALPALTKLHLGGISRTILSWAQNSIKLLTNTCKPGLHLRVEQQFEAHDYYASDFELCKTVDKNSARCEKVVFRAHGVRHSCEHVETKILENMPASQERGVLGLSIYMHSFK